MIATGDDAGRIADLDALTNKVLDWVNDRRAFASLEPLLDLRPVAFADDPITESMPPGCIWVIGQLQFPHEGRIVQITVGKDLDYIRTWLAEWRAGQHPDYG